VNGRRLVVPDEFDTFEVKFVSANGNGRFVV
jgi:hypothetical protein